jgi:predicted FMN-binding regulatory protein PaiB
MLGAITGVILRIRAGASRFKYGQNKPARTRQAIAEALERRGLGQDAAAAEQVRAHLPADPAAESPSA